MDKFSILYFVTHLQ